MRWTRTVSAADLGEKMAALDARHRGGGERGGVRVFAEPASGLHSGEAVAEVGFPAFKAGGDSRSCVGVLFGEAADRTAVGCLPFDHRGVDGVQIPLRPVNTPTQRDKVRRSSVSGLEALRR